MSSDTARRIVPGSRRDVVAGAVVEAAVPDDEHVEVSLRIRPRAQIGPASRPALSDVAPARREYLPRAAFAAAHGASAEDLAAVAAFARSHGIAVAESSAARRTVRLAGPAGAMCVAFEVELHRCRLGSSTWRGRTGTLSLPADIADIVEGVFGLDTRPQARPQWRRQAAASTSFTVTSISLALARGVLAEGASGEESPSIIA